MQKKVIYDPLRSAIMLFLFSMCLSLTAQTGAYYHLINGSFAKFEDASAQVNLLKQQGYNPVVLFPSDDSKHYRVSIYHSLDQNEVRQFASQAKKQGKPSGWVLTLTDPSSASIAAVKGSTSATARTAAPTPTTPGNYHLIVGSFAEFDQADALVMSLAQQGYEPYVIFPQGSEKAFRVSVYNSQDRGEIEAYTAMMKKRGKEKGWIYEEKDPAPNTLATNFRVATRGGDAVETFHLIGGSFQRYDQASAYAEEARKTGHSPTILFPNMTGSDRYRVSLYSSDKKAEITRYRKQLEKEGKPAGWIYEKK